MRLAVARVRRIGVLLAALALSACGPKIEKPLFDLSECRRVALVDAETGERIRGAEDIAVDATRGRLIVSAYDRRKAERGVRMRADAVPEGGLYSVNLDGLGAKVELRALPIVDRMAIEGGLRPHGISLDARAGEIAFINRSYFKRAGRWELQPRYVVVTAAGAIVNSGAAHCAANDILFGETIYASFDHASCQPSLADEAAGGGPTGIVDLAGRPVYRDVRFANGLARRDAENFALAGTREKSVLLFKEEAATLAMVTRIKTPGGPDNLAYAPDGALVAAVHPDLFKLGLARRMGIGKSPSRVVSIDPVTERVRILFDDPAAKRISAASVAVVDDGRLIIGSALDEGLAVCGPPN